MKPWKNWWASLTGMYSRSGGVAKLAIFLLNIYRTNLSSLLGGICRFEPSCSVYAQTAFTTYPPAKAFELSVRRLCKCHPLGPFGYDPVPERNSP